jgi:hypothetical protein
MKTEIEINEHKLFSASDFLLFLMLFDVFYFRRRRKSGEKADSEKNPNHHLSSCSPMNFSSTKVSISVIVFVKCLLVLLSDESHLQNCDEKQGEEK